MLARLLLDTHTFIRWATDSRKLTREQARVIHRAIGCGERICLSAVTLLEIATLYGDGSSRMKVTMAELFGRLENSLVFQIVPITIEIANEVAGLGGILRDPADRAIVATARVHGLRLVTSDERIIESKLAETVM